MSFDLETAKIIPDPPEGEYVDLNAHRPLGITCAAACFKHNGEYRHKIWQGVPQLTQLQAAEVARNLAEYVKKGYKLVSFNGLGFDFRTLAEESGLDTLCFDLATNHYDIMFQWFCRKGWRIGQDATCQANGVKGKLHEVKLKDGSTITEMEGSQAPRLWAAGEHEAVISYLREDVRSLLDLGYRIQEDKQILYTSAAGKNHSMGVSGLATVNEVLSWPQPRVYWMTNPTPRSYFSGWLYDQKKAETTGEEVPF